MRKCTAHATPWAKICPNTCPSFVVRASTLRLLRHLSHHPRTPLCTANGRVAVSATSVTRGQRDGGRVVCLGGCRPPRWRSAIYTPRSRRDYAVCARTGGQGTGSAASARSLPVRKTVEVCGSASVRSPRPLWRSRTGCASQMLKTKAQRTSDRSWPVAFRFARFIWRMDSMRSLSRFSDCA